MTSEQYNELKRKKHDLIQQRNIMLNELAQKPISLIGFQHYKSFNITTGWDGIDISLSYNSIKNLNFGCDAGDITYKFDGISDKVDENSESNNYIADLAILLANISRQDVIDAIKRTYNMCTKFDDDISTIRKELCQYEAELSRIYNDKYNAALEKFCEYDIVIMQDVELINVNRRTTSFITKRKRNKHAKVYDKIDIVKDGNITHSYNSDTARITHPYIINTYFEFDENTCEFKLKNGYIKLK